MIPDIAILNTQLEEASIPSNTHRIVYDKNRVNGYTDELAAVRQAVYLILNTERYAYPIYSFDYGVEFYDLIGMDSQLAIPEIKRRVSEALLEDDRIVSISDWDFKINKKKVFVTFVVNTVFGNLDNEIEVNI